jgi:hypothetical protein
MKVAGRTIADETIIEAVASIGVVAVFVGIIVAIGVRFDGSGLTPEGGWALVGAILLFVFLVSSVGAWLAAR